MVRHTHEDVDQMFSRLSVHLSRMAVPTLSRLQELVQEAYSPIPTVHHLDNLWDYRQLGIQAPVYLNGHSTPPPPPHTHTFRFTKVRDDVQMSYKEWPLKSTAYQSITVNDLAKAFDGEPYPIQQVTDKGERVFVAMEEDLRKWRDGGKLSDGHVSWWREHLQRERRFPIPRIPRIPRASSFEPHLRVYENTVSLPAIEVLDNHISSFRKQLSQVKYWENCESLSDPEGEEDIYELTEQEILADIKEGNLTFTDSETTKPSSVLDHSYSLQN
ncbi:uncharacterized protein LOC133171939 [Saccostrea echinata]|uniref:uncharacterized protein LOC133171939 n=1 Tax=Saccostrea echinata TaxID=191078 RepID=UPI002A82DDD2|nr:uncharacterized protein LOC133171939 [Saccostrea echinata]